MPSYLRSRLESHIAVIYPDEERAALVDAIIAAFWPETGKAKPRARGRLTNKPPWSERETILITYANSLVDGDHPPLTLLHHFLDHHLERQIHGVHVLPFFPYTSDDGFAVVDYYRVNSDVGSWDHLRRLGKAYRLMADLVLNHVSSSSVWFTEYLQDKAPGKDFFIEVDPATDLSAVVRPRPHPLLRKVDTAGGARHVWCTFSEDQVDLNFANPEMLLEFLRIMRFHIENGVRTIRLDAVAFVWKEIGTSCIHLPQTHEIVRLMRTLADYAEVPLLLITETNVPNMENLSYFGNRNEAHAVYNFSFPPLIVHALLTGDATALNRWQMTMPPAPRGCFYFNFVASHDGIGLRPAEGLLSEEELASMIAAVEAFGGAVSLRAMPDGTFRPYEMNIALYDAFKGKIDGVPDGWRRERFLSSQTVMMALEGIPAFYIHSLLATPNDHDRRERTGHNRSLNRHQWNYPDLEARLADPLSDQAVILGELKRRIAIRTDQKAFHPNATQFTLQLGGGLFGLWRQSMDREQSIFAINNLTDRAIAVPLVNLNLIRGETWTDILSGETVDAEIGAELVLAPYQSVWLTNRAS
ncbi:sugar phosphorylase [Pararhizobium haloflavum]|uniref:sugar phosphorylase n=1 Tax=Pararhizobium haloflavum TaxID=2037914 RepID=UPI000C1A2998|nr:sugar phosphorylase [Pararhizobium haloflavum]